MNESLVFITLDDSESLDECPPEFRDVFLSEFWSYEKTFVNSMLAKNYLEVEKMWVLHERRSFDTESGYKQTYKCNVEKACSAAKCLFYPINKTEVLLFRSNSCHEHVKRQKKIINTTTKMDYQIIARAEKLIELQMKPIDIIRQMELEGLGFNKAQLQRKLYNLARGGVKIDNWDVEKSFKNLSDTIDYLESQKIWSLQSKTVSHGVRYHYRCNLVPETGPQCATKMFFCYNSKSFQTVLYKSNISHTHDLILSKRVSSPTPIQTQKRKLDLLMDHLTNEEQTILEKRGFQIMRGVQLKDCLVEKLKEVTDQKPQPIVKTSITSLQNGETENDKKCVYITENDTNYVINFIDKKVASTVDANNVITSDPKRPKLPRAKSKWIFDRSFDNINFAEAYLATLKIWSKFTKSTTQLGLKQYYNCSLRTRTTPRCDAKLYLLHLTTSGKIQLFRNYIKHSHPNIQPQILELEPMGDLCDEDPTLILQPDKIHKEVTLENTAEWMLTKKFENLQMANTYLKNICMNLVLCQQYAGNNLEFYTCGLNPLNACLVTQYKDEFLEVLLYKNNKIEHTQFSLVSNFEQSKTIVNWLKSESYILATEDYDKPFIANYSVNYKKQSIQCFITTKRLLRMALDSRIIHADYTCTLKWRTYSIIVLGTTDMDQTFHSFGICISPSQTEYDYRFAFRSLNKGILECLNYEYKPQILICNSVYQIQNAFQTVYGYTKLNIIICHDFMIREVSSKLKLTVQNDSIQNEIIDDIQKIQKVHTSEIFAKAVTLFLKKWSTQTKFLEYFRTTWIHQNNNWYSGFLHYVPSTNAALVAEYNGISAEYESELYCTFSSLQFFMFDIVKSWTNAYVNQTKAFAQKPTVPITLYEEACHWRASQTNIEIQEIDNDTKYYYVPNENAVIGPDIFKQYKSKNHLCLDNLFEVQFSFWEIKKKGSDITCSCPYFFQHNICKHTLGMASMLTFYVIPTEMLGEDELKMESNEEILS